MAFETPPTSQQEDLSSLSNSGVSILLYTHLVDESTGVAVPFKESAWYLISPTSESGETLYRVFADVPPPENGLNILEPGLAIIGTKIYFIGGSFDYWPRCDPTPFYSAIRCLDTRADPLGWKTISHLPDGYIIARTAVSAPWIYVFGSTREAYNLPAVPRPWGYAINVDYPEKTFPLPAPYPDAESPVMCAVVEEGLLVHCFGDDTLHLLNLQDLSYSVHHIPGECKDYHKYVFSRGVFYRYLFKSTIFAYDMVRRVHLPSCTVPQELFRWFGHRPVSLEMFPALDGKIGMFMYCGVCQFVHLRKSCGFICVAYVEFSILYGDDSAEMVFHRRQKLYLHGDRDIKFVPRYPCGDQVSKVDEQQQEKSTKKKSKKKKKRRGKKEDSCNIHDTGKNWKTLGGISGR